MTRLGIEYAEFWIALIGQSVAQLAYVVQAKTWTITRVWFHILGLITVPWLIIGLISRVHNTDDTHIFFFGTIGILFVVQAAIFITIAVRMRRKRSRHAAE